MRVMLKENLDMLLDCDKLIFTRDDLLLNDFHRRTSGKKLSDKLNLDFDKPLAIIRVLDSRSEKLMLKKPYNEVYTEIYNCYTCPEIEYLLILHNCDERPFEKGKLKPCEFCKKHYGYTKSRDKKYFTNNFSIEEIISMLKNMIPKVKKMN